MRESIVFYKSFVEALNELPDENRLRLYDAIFNFGIYGNEPELSGIDAAVFMLIRPQIEANNRKYENGIKGGRPKPSDNQTRTKTKPNNNQTITNEEPNNNQAETKPEPNVNVNDNDNVNVNEKGNVNASGLQANTSARSLSLSLISYLNSKTGSSYRNSEQIQELIEQRLSEGYTEEDLKLVIDRKCSEWSCDGKMRTYLRPSTLFGDKFGEYLNAPEPIEVEEERRSSKKSEKLREELEEKQGDLDSINAKLSEIVQSGKYLSDGYDEYNDLKLKREILTERVENLQERLGAS